MRPRGQRPRGRSSWRAEAVEGEAAGAKAVQMPTSTISANTRLWGCWKGREVVGGKARGGRGCSVAKNSNTSNEETLGMLEQKNK